MFNNPSCSAKDLVRRMLTVEPKDRFSTDDVLAHPWIAVRDGKGVFLTFGVLIFE